MAATCRFAFAVHILTVLAFKDREVGNSDALADSVNTNAVVIRRILSELRRAGLVKTQKGAGGGATLSRPPKEITLDAVYRAVECGPAFSHHPQHPDQRCPVGRKIEQVLEEVFSSVETALQAALARRTLADVLETVIEEPATVETAAPTGGGKV
jgi:Rrf2 family protein